MALLDRLALLFSYAWEMLALPVHAARLAGLRLTRRRVTYELQLGLEQELQALRATIRVAKRMEQDLAKADLALPSSRRLAILAFRSAIDRLRRRVAASFSEDAHHRAAA